jgi:hypothetical protein
LKTLKTFPIWIEHTFDVESVHVNNIILVWMYCWKVNYNTFDVESVHRSTSTLPLSSFNTIATLFICS